jgi:DNA polymerase
MTQQEQNKILHNLYLQQSFGYRYIEPFHFKKIETKDTFMSHDTLEQCTLCDASKITKHKIYHSGNSNSHIMFLTTVPTFDEASKEMFYKMVENVIGLSVDTIYLTSILKCDISEKTPQLSSYIAQCKDYINNQIENSDAKIIVTLGDSYNYLLNDQSEISSIRGSVMKLNNKSIIPIYHPSFLLRNPSLKKETFEDLKKIKLLLEQL